jgi:hypothetical protein
MNDVCIGEVEALRGWLIEVWGELLEATMVSLQVERDRAERFSFVLEVAIRRLGLLRERLSD